jgi:hypothetical protein
VEIEAQRGDMASPASDPFTKNLSTSHFQTEPFVSAFDRRE